MTAKVRERISLGLMSEDDVGSARQLYHLLEGQRKESHDMRRQPSCDRRRSETQLILLTATVFQQVKKVIC